MTLTVDGWQHPGTGKLHTKPNCLAVLFHREHMLDTSIECDHFLEELLPITEARVCPFCFPLGRGRSDQHGRSAA